MTALLMRSGFHKELPELRYVMRSSAEINILLVTIFQLQNLAVSEHLERNQKKMK